MSECVLIDVAAKVKVAFTPILHNSASTLDLISSNKLSNLVLVLSFRSFTVSLNNGSKSVTT